MANTSIIITIIICIIGTGLLSLIWWLQQRRKEEIVEVKTDTSFINQMPQFLDGHYQGWEQKIEKAKNGRLKIYCYCTDQEDETVIDKELKLIVVPEENRKVLPRGKNSMYKATATYYAKNTNDIPLENLNFETMKEIGDRSIIRNLKTFVNARESAQASAIRLITGKEFTPKEFKYALDKMKILNDRLTEMREPMIDLKKDKKKFT